MTTKLTDLNPRAQRDLPTAKGLDTGDWFIAEDGDLGVRTTSGVLFVTPGEFHHYDDPEKYCILRTVDVDIQYK